jgi:glycosyltransferase involved in cell wall biosynthesis
MQKTVLLLAYCFPPHGGIAAQRPASLFRFLPEFGWTPHVITNLWNSESTTSLDKDFDRSDMYERNVIECDGNKESLSLNKKIDWWSDKFMPWKTPRSWFRAALREADRFCKSNPPDAIWATYGPHGALKIASLMRNKYRIPWIADFRDTARLLGRNLTSWYNTVETLTCQNATAMTTVSKDLADELRFRHNRPVEIIYNGFFPEDLSEHLNEPPNKEIFSLCYTGSIDPRQRDPSILFDALDLLLFEKKISSLDFSVRFIGTSKSVLKRFSTRPSSSLLTISEWLPRSKVRRLRADASALILITSPNLPGVLTGKVFEYIVANRPVIAIPDDNGSIKNLLSETNTGTCYNSPRDLANRIHELYIAWKQGIQSGFNPNWASIQRFSRRSQVGNIAEILNRITTNQRDERGDTADNEGSLQGH